MIPRSVINTLKCSLCTNSLSVFPIHTYGSRDTPVCGRCSVQNEFAPQRQDLFEELAQHIEFPCRYQSNGCIENLKPSEMKNHEERCPHKPCLCPILPLGACKWQGNYSDLYEHYSHSHPALTFRDFQTEVEIISTYEENYMLQHEDEAYIVQLKCDSITGKCYSNVICADSESKTKKIVYRACFTDNKQNMFCGVHNVQFIDIGMIKINDDTTVVNINDILTNLNNPVCVICKIEIIVHKIAAETAKKPAFIEDENEMLKTLECPICFDYMVPPIMQCNGGCSFCGHHRDDLTECPKCRGSVGGTRNYLLEQITNIIEYPCKHVETGCSYKANAKTIREHESSCVYGPFKCIIESCTWQNKFSDLKAHLQQMHKDNVLELNLLTYILAEDLSNESFTYVLLNKDNIFKLLFRRDNDTYLWSLQIVGDNDNYLNYMLELDFNGADRIYIRKRCGPLVDSLSIKDDSVIQLSTSNLRNFINDDMLIYKARIVEIK